MATSKSIDFTQFRYALEGKKWLVDGQWKRFMILMWFNTINLIWNDIYKEKNR